MDKDFRITKLDDVDAEAHMGQLFMAARYYDEAETSLANSIEANPDQVTAYEAMAILRDRQGNQLRLRASSSGPSEMARPIPTSICGTRSCL